MITLLQLYFNYTGNPKVYICGASVRGNAVFQYCIDLTIKLKYTYMFETENSSKQSWISFKIYISKNKTALVCSFSG